MSSNSQVSSQIVQIKNESAIWEMCSRMECGVMLSMFCAFEGAPCIYHEFTWAFTSGGIFRLQYFSSTMFNRWLERFWNKEKKFNKWKRQRDKYLLWTQIFSVWRLWVRPDCPVYINFAFFCHHCLKIFFLHFLTFLQQSTWKHMILRFFGSWSKQWKLYKL